MFRLFESIRLFNGEFQNLDQHLSRIARSSREVLGKDRMIEISDSLKKVARPTEGLYKARLQYDWDAERISYIPYQVKPIHSLKLVDCNITYDHKYSNRSELEQLYALRGSCDDVIMVKNGMVTDASYANLVFRKSREWITPRACLLPGTMRQALLLEGKITEGDIEVGKLEMFESVKLINAMLGWNGPELGINKIER